MEKETGALAASFVDQWARTWGVWKEMIRAIPDADWRQGDCDYLVPARYLIYVAVRDDVFTSDTPFDPYDPLQWFGLGEWGTFL
jgi:hypothetical protein